MKFYLLILLIPQIALCGELMDLGREDLVHLIYNDEPGSHTKLENELRSGEARAFIEKFKDDPRLQKALVSFPKLIPDQDLREEVILYALREPAIWDFTDEEDPAFGAQLLGQCAYSLSIPLSDELGLAPGDPDRSRLSSTLVETEGRYAIERIHAGVLALDRSERTPENREMIALKANLQAALERYGRPKLWDELMDEMRANSQKRTSHREEKRPELPQMPRGEAEVINPAAPDALRGAISQQQKWPILGIAAIGVLAAGWYLAKRKKGA